MSYIEQLQQDTMFYRPRITYNILTISSKSTEEEPTVAMPNAQHYDLYKTVQSLQL